MSLIEVKIPSMGESITTGVLAKWHVADGDIVMKDQPLYELETDKITSEGVAESAGRITLKADASAEVKIGELIATIEIAVDASHAKPSASSATPATGTASVPPAGGAAAKPVFPASPAVRRLAADTGIDPATIPGTGKAGRVTKADFLAAIAAPVPVPAPPLPPPVSTPLDSSSRQTRKKLTPLRQRIAQRLVQAQHAAAMLTTFNECDMSAVMALRAKYQDDFVKRNGVKLGFMSFFTKAVVHALKEVPAINSRLDGDTIVQNHYYDIGVAVSTEKGLMVPVIRDCDRLDMSGIERTIADSAKRARESKVTLADLEGGVFTITNGGIFGSMLSTPILNSPQSAILGLHAVNERPVARDGQIVIRPMMYLALSYDHRLVDGKEAVTFLVKVKQAIEDPARLLLSI